MPKSKHSTILDAALDLFKRGITPVQLRPRSKKPVHDDWHKKQLTEAEIVSIFTGGTYNVGAQLGPASSHLVDVEFDSETARTLAPQFLPPTPAIFERRSKPRSHWLYCCPALHDGQHNAFISLKDANGKEMAGLRIGDAGKGAQSMVPPSIHPDGEPIEWAKGCRPEPAQVGAELEQQFRYCVVAAILADLWPRENNSRNDLANAVAGWLARRELTEEQAAAIIGAAAELPKTRK